MIIRIITFAILIFFCVIGLTAIHQVDKERMLNITETSLHNSFQNASQSFKIIESNNF